jgi:7-keto-8-aminopelargonate synthetase-like enzyme
LRLAERWDAMVYIDDAHGTGVLGASGGGILDHFSLASERLIYMATLSKAYGSIGGYVASHALITEILRMSCQAYGFTATLPPDQAMVISTAIDVVRDEPERRQRLWDNQRYFVKRMAELNYKLVAAETPIAACWRPPQSGSHRPQTLHRRPAQPLYMPQRHARTRGGTSRCHGTAHYEHARTPNDPESCPRCSNRRTSGMPG